MDTNNHTAEDTAPEPTSSDLRHAFEARIGTDQDRELWRALDGVINAERAAMVKWACDCVDELARHLPGVGPAIRVLWQDHILPQNTNDIGRCCTTEAPAAD